MIAEKYDAKGFGLRLRKRRRELDLSQHDLAQKLGRTTSLVSHWEHGIREPRLLDLVGLIRVLKVTADWLLATDEDGTR